MIFNFIIKLNGVHFPKILVATLLTKETNWYDHTLEYDYLAISLGEETNFFGMEDVALPFSKKDTILEK